MPVIYGINPVREALKARWRKFEYVAVARELTGFLWAAMTDQPPREAAA